MIEWTPELADKLIELMQAYPRTLSAFARGADNAGFYEAFKFAVFAQQEALLQFPTAPQADDWLWDLAFNLARTGDSKAIDAYALLITNQLNSEAVDLFDLTAFGKRKDPRIDIEITRLEAIPGYIGNNIVKVTSNGNGGAIFWLLETPNGFESYPLASQFDFIDLTSIDFFVEDLTKDGEQEVVTFRSAVPGTQVYEFPRIFSLGSQPPEELVFEFFDPPQISPDFQTKWAAVEDIHSEGDLQFFDTIFPTCPVKVQHEFKWNGVYFEFLSAEYTVEPDPSVLNFCELVVNHAIRAWGPHPTIQIMKTILPFWPPEATVDGDPYPEGALDEWRYRLGIYHALDGNITQAREYLQGITINPAIPNSRWIDPANEFLETYQDPRDIYRACLPADFCDPRAAIRAVVETFSSDDYSNALQILADAGILVRSSGYFDFDDDGATERWFILRASPVSKPEFWILMRTTNGVEALLVGQVDETQPRISITEPTQELPTVQLGRDTAFIVRKAPSGPSIELVKPMRVFSVDLTQEELDGIEAQLLSGADPADIRDDLLELEGSGIFTCNFIICPKFHYLLGLANELEGNDDRAVDSYLTLWRDFPRSPFTTMARLKLQGILPTPTPTASPTPTLTPRPTHTATPTLTPTPTRVEPISGTIAPTQTPSETPAEGYPAPVPTDTPRSGYP